jgi:uncharacterized membrane protein YdjX (TVP38/TMEM64 family)
MRFGKTKTGKTESAQPLLVEEGPAEAGPEQACLPLPSPLRRLALPFTLGLLIAALYFSGVLNWFDFQTIQAERDTFAAFTQRHRGEAMALFCLAYIFGLILCVPIGTALGLLSGYLFGLWIGMALVVFSATMGGTFLFLLAKTSFGDVLRRKMGGFYAKIEDNMRENAVFYLLFMRLVPVFPYIVINVLPALFNVRLRTFLITSIFGMIPGVFVLVNLGRALADIHSPSDLLSPQLLLAFSFLGLLALLPILYKKLMRETGLLRSRMRRRGTGAA